MDKLMTIFTVKKFNEHYRFIVLIMLTALSTIIISSAVAVPFADVPIQIQKTSEGVSPKATITSQTSAAIKLTPTTLTPGQQLTVEVIVNYFEGVELFFDVKQYQWQPFHLVSHSETEPQWLNQQFANNAVAQKTQVNNQWQKSYVINLIVPLAGDYHLPEMILHSYLNEQHSAVVIPEKNITISSSFPLHEEPAKLQTIEDFVPLVKQQHNSRWPMNKPITLVLFTAMVLLVIYFIRNNKAANNKKGIDNA